MWHTENLKRTYWELIQKCWSYYKNGSRLFKVWKFAIYCRSFKKKDCSHKNVRKRNFWTRNQYIKYESSYQRGYIFEIYCKTKLNILNKFLGKDTGRWHNDNVPKIVNTINLPKLEISKFNGEPTKWPVFFSQLVSSRSW